MCAAAICVRIIWSLEEFSIDENDVAELNSSKLYFFEDQTFWIKIIDGTRTFRIALNLKSNIRNAFSILLSYGTGIIRWSYEWNNLFGTEAVMNRALSYRMVFSLFFVWRWISRWKKINVYAGSRGSLKKDSYTKMAKSTTWFHFRPKWQNLWPNFISDQNGINLRPNFRPKWQNLRPNFISDQNGKIFHPMSEQNNSKTIPIGVAI